ncbi:delta(1)-pyrroline-2-carboxylate reductase family protein [Acetobacter indonesiensis]|uniref:delta(1)-pyrroline-2-carboxylate reductase family protein n=1 Tax=Acetobacter indonesiensis TaxID=104101 RepID=UPI0020A2F441|nr:delta(1)-pyrroline-2-carboxylate reductase family protein [Acetobacter indonesiensis]MCP1230253.1 delta(1)-pyrroline-2-carboxylate reductase family protein [Acetobacter indonesiensis]
MQSYSASETRALLPYPALLDALARTMQDYAAGLIRCPERLTVGAPDRSSVLMTMPTASKDLLVTKLLTICPDNAGTEHPTIQGIVTCADARTGVLLFSLDGPTVTMRRTSAVSMLGIKLLTHRPAKKVLIIGTGAQAVAHIDALSILYPDSTVHIRGRTPDRATTFCQQHSTPNFPLHPEQPGEHPFDVILTVTASTSPLFDSMPTPECLVIGVGAYRPDMIEVGPQIVRNSLLYVDDPIGAPTEAGDLIQAGIDWQTVRPLASALTTPAPENSPVFFKSVGCAAWDLAACAVVAASASES